jgi:ABC-type uncharacterized transport system permease subunit
MGPTVIPAALAALMLYLGSALWQGKAMLQGKQVTRSTLMSLAVLAVCLHGLSVLQMVFTSDGLNLGFYQVSSLIFWVMCTVLVLSCLKMPVENLFAILFPLAALSITCSVMFRSGYQPQEDIPQAIGWHILLSILAYSILTIATVQALALALQDKLLKQKRLEGIIAVLPPLQTMEALLFEMLHAGLTLLTLSLATGFLFFENIMEQHLAHKMVLSSIAWLTYAILVFGRHRWGWRGKTAIHWALGGFVALMLSYFGSKFVLEILLSSA